MPRLYLGVSVSRWLLSRDEESRLYLSNTDEGLSIDLLEYLSAKELLLLDRGLLLESSVVSGRKFCLSLSKFLPAEKIINS